MKHFRIEAIVSLPYDAFKPFTSTKTCIVYAQKRPASFIDDWDKALIAAQISENIAEDDLISHVLKELGIDDETIFMAEPNNIGYKRRKNLSDLVQPNDLYREDDNGFPIRTKVSELACVLDYWRDNNAEPNSSLGFRVPLSDIVSRPAFRMDPKYCWLWYFEGGCISANPTGNTALGSIISTIDLPKIKKQTLPSEVPLIDLDLVAARQGTLTADVPVVDEIGSDRVVFQSADILFSKLEPYLGKVLFEFPADAIGSPEWIGFKIKSGVSKHFVAYLLMHPAFCEAFRRLQSGKRHARLDPDEMLELQFGFDKTKAVNCFEKELLRVREEIDHLAQRQKELRNKIDNVIGKAANLRTR